MCSRCSSVCLLLCDCCKPLQALWRCADTKRAGMAKQPLVLWLEHADQHALLLAQPMGLGGRNPPGARQNAGWPRQLLWRSAGKSKTVSLVPCRVQNRAIGFGVGFLWLSFYGNAQLAEPAVTPAVLSSVAAPRLLVLKRPFQGCRLCRHLLARSFPSQGRLPYRVPEAFPETSVRCAHVEPAFGC